MATSYRVTVADLWPGLYTWVSVPPEPFSDPFPLSCSVPHSLAGLSGAETLSFAFLPGLVQPWARLSFFSPLSSRPNPSYLLGARYPWAPRLCPSALVAPLL